MAAYPDSVITHDKKGRPEVRWLVDKGRFVRYQYKDPDTGALLEKGKFSIILKNEEGREDHFYLIPIQNRFLAVPIKGEAKERKVWSSKGRKAESLFS